MGIANGWLPPNTFDVVTRPDAVIDTVLAPSGRLYLKDLRFHFDESNDFSKGNKNINGKGDVGVVSDGTNWVQHQLFAHLAKEEIVNHGKQWLWDLKGKVAPKVCNQMLLLDECYEADEDCGILDLNPAPDEYLTVLTLLRELAMTGWPETSTARSKVIKNIEANSAMDRDQISKKSFGSFTIVNPKLFQPTSTQQFPLGNQLFPELVQSVFKLEEDLCQQTMDFAFNKQTNKGIDSLDHEMKKRKSGRNPSTHCDVNFNASLTPHVDSGTGLGQSLSVIVELGDYKGGEIFVEGDAYPIRYKPLEFDGWKQRHWTGMYTGERFSLVWFTPEQKE